MSKHVTYTIRANDGLPPVHWTFELHRIADRVEVEAAKDGHDWGVSSVHELLSVLRGVVPRNSFRALANKLEQAALEVALS